MTARWPCPAKLNLFLYITGQRADGYHSLQTLFQFLDFGDWLDIDVNQSGTLQLLTAMPSVASEDNLIYRAASKLKQQAIADKRCLPTVGADIAWQKNIPMGGGLGGGSSNAATSLVALNYLWQTGYSLAELADLALPLGADIPVFIQGQAAFAEGIGEQLQPASPPEKWYLVAHPGVSIPTPLIFNDAELTRNSPVRSLSALMAAPWANDCESIARKRFRKVDELLQWLLEYGPSRLTGTGACVFTEFDTEDAARQVLSLAPEWISGFVAKGANISMLHRYLSE